MAQKNTQIDLLRKKIESLDADMLKNLAKRFKISQKISNLKQKAHLKVHQPDREKKILKKYLQKAKKMHISIPLVKTIFQSIFEQSRKEQLNLQKSRGKL